jgi:tetratricopeptide (TPR) repeat protein
LLYHKLYVDLENGYKYFSGNFPRIVNLRQNSFARSLLREVQQFRAQMSPTQLYNLKYGEARLLQKEEAADLALKLFQELEQEADQKWRDEHQADILFEKGVAYQQLSRYPEAIECFTSAMEIEKKHGRMSDYAYLLNWLGSVYQKQGQLDTALRYYQDGLEIHKGLHNERAYANALLSISNVYRLQGKVEEALRRAKTSLRIRQDLFKRGKMSEVYIGWSLTSIGNIYYQTNDFLKAEGFFQEALDIFVRTGHKRGLATIYNRIGKLSMDRGELYHAQQWFEKAYSTSLGIYPESQINSLNMQGWILVLEGQYQKAIQLLQQAIDLAKAVYDDYQQAESLVDLAEALKRSGHNEQSQQARQKAREICLKYHYYYLLGLSSESEGDVLYESGDYKEAFRNYGEACYYMTQYNDLQYKKRLRKVVDALFDKVPSEEITPIVDELVAYWSSQGLDKDYPDFVSSCQEVKSLVGF